MFRRVVLIILDACGVGELPDAAEYGDTGAATIPNVARELKGLKMPHCERMGLGNIVEMMGIRSADPAAGCWGKMAEKSSGKDSTSGHWEIAGVILERAFPVYPHGFPSVLVMEFERQARVKCIGNIAASGTEIIKELGERHIKTGEIILYTSADSVFQLAAHEEIFPLERLYEICRIAREMLTREDAVGRVIARPFAGSPGNFTRTVNRRDFSLLPPSDTALDKLLKAGIATVGIGKIGDLYAHRGLSREVKASNNNEVMIKIIAELGLTNQGLIMANLVDFDMLWGHRNDTASFGKGLEDFDRRLEELLPRLNQTDLLIITADHGCDPTLKNSTDHTREYVPLLACSKDIKSGKNLGTRETFADIGTTIGEIFDLDYHFPGKSFLKDIVESIH
ncbi:MAG: phosphopentomutase [candidate division Zixibacteria bacterium]|nr:phosphopentomutase [candidate division Zixibacteria bacterium]